MGFELVRVGAGDARIMPPETLPCGAMVGLSIEGDECGAYFGREDGSAFVALTLDDLRAVARWAPDDAGTWQSGAIFWRLNIAACAAAAVTSAALVAAQMAKAGEVPPALTALCVPSLTVQDGVALGALAARFLGE